MITTEKKYYDVTRLLQERITDFEIMREDPIVFRAGSSHIVCKPVKYYKHYDFLDDLAKMFTKYGEIFSKIDFISANEFKDKDKIVKMVGQMTLFSTTKEYKKFTKKGLPSFIKTWAYKIKGNEIVKLTNRDIKKFMGEFTIDELIEVLLTIFNFNYSIVKKKIFGFLQVLNDKGVGSQEDMISSNHTKNKVVQMPKFSLKPFSKSTLKLMSEQSKM